MVKDGKQALHYAERSPIESGQNRGLMLNDSELANLTSPARNTQVLKM
jgi:hypothetical protein